ncbi:TFIIB-type zinc ribbon-containing protein [Camelliibacillus cellulosilyticus]|uniref:TFIIB-type zinc ribbon-containing protein n=1 Tax=Camelliibacillus cellulosilyticus TaxID=2174486 RepID=A0ABV9GQV7_9BACL
MILYYKCPSCGNDMTFDPKTGELTCDSCGRVENIENYPEELKEAKFSPEETTEYHCENCGAVLITTADTVATHCSFCGAGVVIADRLSGHLAPKMVIPFTITKEEAVEAFKKWCGKGLLTPKGFMSADRIKRITGMYIPFWLYDLNSKVQVRATCTRESTYEQGDYIYTETKFYDAYRDINLNYVKIPVDASEKMDDQLMDKLEPFSYDQLKDFKSPYLVGYLAEKYNYTDDDLLPRVKEKISSYIESYISSTFRGYHTVNYKQKDIHTKNVNSFYALLPVWMVSYDYNKTVYTFAMNGETGKVVGKPPISKGKVAAWFGGIAVTSFFALKCVSLIMGGGFW